MYSPEWEDCTDGNLALAAMLGEFEAFDELVRRYRPAVTAVARQIAGSAAAEDVAQDSLLLAFKALPQLDEPERFGSWLAAITRHRAARVAQGRAGREETGYSDIDALIVQQTPALQAPYRTAASAAECVLREEGCRLVREELESLPEELRIVLYLRYFESLPVGRISEFLGLPQTTVKWRLHRGRQLLRRRLESNGHTGENHE